MHVSGDFETRSTVDLNKCGVHVYAEDPTTQALCFAFAFLGGPTQGFFIVDDVPQPLEVFLPLKAHIEAGGEFHGHNVAFELAIWAMLRRRRPDIWPELKPEQCRCTMVSGLALALPGKLEKLGEALRLPIVKDMTGHAVMKKLCKPRKPRKNERKDLVLWHDDPEDHLTNLRYCMRDTEVEQMAAGKTFAIADSEQRLWVIDQSINNRGVKIDVPAARALLAVAEAEKERINAELYALTGGAVPSIASNDKLRNWLATRGVVLDDLKKTTVADAIAVGTRPGSNQDPAATKALQLRQEGNKASTAKLEAMLRGVNADGRARGLFQFNGAGTRRWAGRRIQLQNMPRPTEGFEVEHAEDVIQWVGADGVDIVRAMYGSPLQAIADSLRALLIAENGFRFLSADYSNIEGRMSAWLAGEEWKLKAFRAYDAKTGPDLYKLAFSNSFGVPVEQVTKPQRQIGKVQELALQYQGAHGAYISMGKNYAIDLDEVTATVQRAVSREAFEEAKAKYWRGVDETLEEIAAAREVEAKIDEANGDALTGFEPEWIALRAEVAKGKRYGLNESQWAALRIVVDGWRLAHPATVRYWDTLNTAAVAAAKSPGIVTTAGRIKYQMHKGYLLCQLPSGGVLGYPYARVEEEIQKFPDGNERKQLKLVYEGVDSKTKRWRRQRGYGGFFLENVTQASSRDILAHAIENLEAAHYPVVLHVHDEAVSEVPNGFGSLREFESIMARLPDWAGGLPVAVEGWEGLRYRK